MQGFLDALDFYDGLGWVAKGWAHDPDRPDRPVPLQLWCETGHLCDALADRLRPDLAAAGYGSGHHAFEILLPHALLDGKPHLIHVVHAQSGRPLGQSPRVFVMPRARGRLETVQGLTLEGWVKDDLDPGRAPVLDVLVDGRLSARIAGDRYRADLARSLGTAGHNAFRHTLPIALCDGAPHEVVLRVSNTDIVLDGCPASVRLSPAAVPPALRRASDAVAAAEDAAAALRRRLERLPLRTLDDQDAYARWLHVHEARWRDLRPEPAQSGAAPVLAPAFTIIVEDLDGPDAVAALAARLDAATPCWELVTGVSGVVDTRVVTSAVRGAGFLGTALERARGEVVLLLPAGHTPHPALLAELAAAFGGDAGVDAVTVDEDTLAIDGTRSAPLFKPAWDPDRCMESGYVGAAAAVRRAVLVDAWRRLAPAGFTDWCGVVESALLALPAECVRHRPCVLWHRPPGVRSEPAEVRAARLRLMPGVRAEVVEGRVRVRHPVPDPAPPVTLIVPTRDRADLLRTCVDSLLTRTRYPALSLLIVDNGSVEPDALALLAALERDARVRVLRRPGPFNFSTLNNDAVALIDTPLVGLVNNDVEVIAPDWLAEMVAHALRPDVGAVGAKLLFPDGRIQHGGVVVGFHGVADNAQQAFDGGEPGYAGSAVTTQNASAVTAACLLCRRDVYLAVGGLDEEAFAVSFNDVDFCLKLRARGLRVIWTPHARLTHHESASRGAERSPEARRREEAEADRLRAKWRTEAFDDPFYSPNLARTGYSHCDFAWPSDRG